jgi:hypothetical protein
MLETSTTFLILMLTRAPRRPPHASNANTAFLAMVYASHTNVSAVKARQLQCWGQPGGCWQPLCGFYSFYSVYKYASEDPGREFRPEYTFRGALLVDSQGHAARQAWVNWQPLANVPT